MKICLVIGWIWLENRKKIGSEFIWNLHFMWLSLVLILISYSVMIFTFVHMIAVPHTVITEVIVTGSSEAYQADFLRIFQYLCMQFTPNCNINGQNHCLKISFNPEEVLSFPSSQPCWWTSLNVQIIWDWLRDPEHWTVLTHVLYLFSTLYLVCSVAQCALNYLKENNKIHLAF